MTEQNLKWQNAEENVAEGLSLHDIVQMVLCNWYWFLLSVTLCLVAAWFYQARKPCVYSRTATIPIKDGKNTSSELAVFSDLTGFQTINNVDNELFILGSRKPDDRRCALAQPHGGLYQSSAACARRTFTAGRPSR